MAPHTTQHPASSQAVFLGLGSNLGDRLGHFRLALQGLAEAGVVLRGLSAIYETPPFGPVEQNDFLNAVVEVQTNLQPLDLLAVLQTLEMRAERKRELTWGPRTLDLDLLAFGELALNHPRLQVPHPGLAERAFVLGPWRELAPHYHPPGSPASISELWERLAQPEREAIRPYANAEQVLAPLSPPGSFLN